MRALLLLGAVLAGCVPGAAHAEKLEVMNWYTNPSEARALSVIEQAFEAQGGEWQNSPVVNDHAMWAVALQRFAAHNPPAVVQWNAGVIATSLAQEGKLRFLDADQKQGNWRGRLPAGLFARVSLNGRMFAVPVDIHGGNWMWFSPAVFRAVGVAPPKTWAAFFAEADRIRAAGYIPLAVGDTPGQDFGFFTSLMIGVGGKKFYRAVFDGHDKAAAAGPAMVRVFATLRRLLPYTDPASKGRSWNDTVMLVGHGRAALQLMGDWAKGELEGAGLKLGKDFGCQMAPGSSQAYQMVVDVFTFPTGGDAARVTAQDLLAKTMMDAKVQAAFNLSHGALPAVQDADMSQFDACAQLGRRILSNPDNQMPNAPMAFDFATQAKLTAIVARFWSDGTYTPTRAAADFAAALLPA